ncbi:hypothetical protein EVJ58_g344 [Rhodofomes roseus]|uniref:Uncharacterized protein n=1 Tax=Rhodofomes roseus TaxID=34475 RepID=A0A4Y9Z417_9APHY|nr:hypothetical protein EVJ58_g344 [Rhodofomes roseus]
MSRASSVGHTFTSFDGSARSTWKAVAFYVVLNTWNEWLHGPNDTSLHDVRSLPSEAAARLLLVEVIKLCLSLVHSLWNSRWTSRYASTGPHYPDEEELEASDLTDSLRLYSHGHESPRGSVEGMVAICPPIRPFALAHVFVVATVFAFYQYNVALARDLTDPLTLYLALSVGTLCTLFLSSLVLLQLFSAIQWHAAILQLLRSPVDFWSSSHARYDANLDFYREVYSQFFPNIVFVGPGTREDKGFQHSYDVLVDSYQSDEDLSDPAFFKMAGRMAHHMLFTAMKEYDCYDGYLWAPFDTLLNVPRLQLFDQRYFWYHSPAATYVPNPALGDAAANNNASRHAPPANISPDPYLDLTSTWKGWGQDWWWGDPHVGLSVCMPAFHRVPPPLREQFRERMAPYTNGTTRLIGGSADTLYIPGRHRQVFMDTLALFLETDCFLEIATPTVVHLSAALEEPILFVDHWWIWQPPFNATYVRQKWAQGYEVDTFHTFHWGDRDSNGVWRGNPAHIADVRALLAESARRQDVEWPWTSSALPDTAPTPEPTS